MATRIVTVIQVVRRIDAQINDCPQAKNADIDRLISTVGSPADSWGKNKLDSRARLGARWNSLLMGQMTHAKTTKLSQMRDTCD